MSNMAPAEEQLITGRSMASWSISDLISVGDVLTFTIIDTNGTHNISYTVTEQDVNLAPNPINPPEASPSFSVAQHASTAINNALNAAGYQAAGVMPADLFTVQYLPPYFAEVTITSPGTNTNWSIAASVTGTTNFIVNDQAYPSPVTANLFGGSTPSYGYTSILDQLAMGMTNAELSLWLTAASGAGGSGVNLRPDEVKARRRLYRTYCEMLSRDMGGKEYVNHFFGGGSGGGIA